VQQQPQIAVAPPQQQDIEDKVAREAQEMRRQRAIERVALWEMQAAAEAGDTMAEDTEVKEDAADWGDDEPASAVRASSPDAAPGDDTAAGDNDVTYLRRQGLPCRFIVQRQGDLFSKVSGVAASLRLIAHVLEVRNGVVWAERRSASHDGGLLEFSHDGEQWAVLRRAGQGTVFARLMDEFSATYGAKHLELYARQVRASTPNYRLEDETPGRLARLTRGYFKTHCFENFGGQHWLKLLIALGRLPMAAIDQTNAYIEKKLQVENRRASSDSAPSTMPSYAVRRGDRSKRPCLDAERDIYTLKQLRDRCKSDLCFLEADIERVGQAATARQEAAWRRERAKIEETQ